MEPSLMETVQSKLEWIFVGGKGGVGKTTTSCSLATAMASTPVTGPDGTTRPRKVLLVSTDPAHNLSDAFDQKLGSKPTPIKSMETTLFGMEIDPSNFTHGSFLSNVSTATGTTSPAATQSEVLPFAAIGNLVKEAAKTLPGIDELSVFAEILNGVQKLSYDLVIFDTAPTGHTLRLLALPQTLNTAIDKLTAIQGLTPLIEMASSLLSAASNESDAPEASSSAAPAISFTADDAKGLLGKWQQQIAAVQKQFNDPEKTAFICVCIPEFLSVYETERLIQELMKYNINCDSIVVNQLVLKPSTEPPCRMCASRQKIQGKYLSQIDMLYEDFHVVRMPLLADEVRGVPALKQFARFLMEPYDADKHGYLEMGAC